MADDERTYWALLKGGALLDVLDQKRKDFLEFWKQTILYERMCRSYRFYHGLFYPEALEGTAIKVGGSEGELRLVGDNEYRAVIKLLVGYITAQKPEWDALADSSEYTTLEATKLTNQILDSLMSDPASHVEQSLSQAVEDCLVLTAGYFWDLWDTGAGVEVDADEEAGTIEYGGDFKFENPGFPDVVYNHHIRKFEDSTWVIVRRKENKWDLIAQFPDVADDLRDLSIGTESEDEWDSIKILGMEPPETEDEDHLWIYYFYHRKTPAVPAGKFVRYTDGIILEGGTCDHIPVHRIIPSEYMLTCFGYSQMLDAQPMQEALNGVLSIACSNQSALGSNKIWVRQGETVNRADLEPGVSVIQTETPPQSLNFLQTSPEILRAVEVYTGIMERLSGVAAVSRGQVPAAARSAAALAMMDSRTLQNVSDLIAAFRRLLANVGTSIALTLARRATEPRLIALVGKNSQRFIKEFRGEMIARVQRVTIATGNPLMSTMAGRAEMAQFLAQTGLIRTPEELLTVLRTGNLDRLTEFNESQLRAAQAENDALLNGEEVVTFLRIDNHRYHIMKHASVLDTPESRKNADLFTRTGAHILQHVDALKDPFMQQLQVLLGYQLPGPPPEAKGAPAPPKPPGGQNPEVLQRVQEAQRNAAL